MAGVVGSLRSGMLFERDIRADFAGIRKIGTRNE